MSRFVYFFGLLIAAFLALGMFQAKTGAGKSSQRIASLEKKIVEIDEEILLLEQELDALSSQTRIGPLASARLGMKRPDPAQRLSMENAEAFFGPRVEPPEEVAE